MAAAAPLPPVNYDEAAVPPYELPDPLRLPDGRRIADVRTWRAEGRPRVLELFAREMYGRSPDAPAGLHWRVFDEDRAALGGRATRRQVTVWLGATDAAPSLDLLLYVPNRAPRPAPAFLGLNFHGNHAVHADPGIRLSPRWMHEKVTGVVDGRATAASRGIDAASWPVELLLDRGYALATVYYGDLEPDHPNGWRDGVRGALPAPGAAPGFAPDAWGAISAWAWGLSRALDYLVQDAALAADRIGVIGHSRLGKTALWAGAQDERFALVISNNSGCGGAALSRRHFGETVARINTVFPHWFCGNFHAYHEREAALPLDQHMLVALAAPRPVYVASATEDLWADPRGEFLAARHAEPVYALYGAAGLGVAEPPPPGRRVGDRIGYHLRTGPHGLTAADWTHYLDFADRHSAARATSRR